jgi:hypothetical protein
MNRYSHQFTDRLPPSLEPHVLYVSMKCGTVVHLCACSCGRKVVTPLTPKDWKLTFDGETLTLYPSIGNWQYPCRSHYWIRNSRVIWAFHEDETRQSAPSLDREQRRLSMQAKTKAKPQGDRNGKEILKLWNRLRGRLGR